MKKKEYASPRLRRLHVAQEGLIATSGSQERVSTTNVNHTAKEGVWGNSNKREGEDW